MHRDFLKSLKCNIVAESLAWAASLSLLAAHAQVTPRKLLYRPHEQSRGSNKKNNLLPSPKFLREIGLRDLI